MEWSEDCPGRTPGLSHAHWNRCKPPAVHPYDATNEFSGRVHEYNVCCHCEEPIEGDVHSAGSELAPSPGSLGHPFIPTMGGLCGAHGCGMPQVAHPGTQTRAQAEAQAEEFGLNKACPVNHSTIAPKLLIGDEGWSWTTCPSCGIMLEPKEAKGEPVGRPTGIGRGLLTIREQQVVIARVGWRAWLSGNGGGELL